MASEIDLYNQYPLHMDPATKAITLPQSSAYTTTQQNTRSAQITKLRESANAAFRKNNYAEAVRLYTFAIDMGVTRPGWEPVTLAREELAGLYGNRAQAQMALQAWPEGLVDAKLSVDSKPLGNVKAWWRVGKCLAEMTRYEEAKGFLNKGIEIEGQGADSAKELITLLVDVNAALKRVQGA
ncbi:Tetratricopeptide TPR2 [Penicillium waksmanii]|uniref:Tetratricopeptide TPR2 n=1 Tax=Penicillium waksmanii TaxID=69791 RepID=UPI002547B76F|nr:Tetratricopeptide TPR2 [Penicillium waksmanii]KAJ5994932.1 Tetratricopeptide TPR2 [Penicillium waksmanii]